MVCSEYSVAFLNENNYSQTKMEARDHIFSWKTRPSLLRCYQWWWTSDMLEKVKNCYTFSTTEVKSDYCLSPFNTFKALKKTMVEVRCIQVCQGGEGGGVWIPPVNPIWNQRQLTEDWWMNRSKSLIQLPALVFLCLKMKSHSTCGRSPWTRANANRV